MTREWKDQLDEVEAVITAWSDASRMRVRTVTSDDASDYLGYFQSFSITNFKSELKGFRSKRHDDKWVPFSGYLTAKPVDVGSPAMFPLVKFVMRVKADELELAIRLVTFFVNETETEIDQNLYGSIDAHGWRFETADSASPDDTVTTAFHNYPHVQRIMAWEKNGLGLYPPEMANPPAKSQRLQSAKWNESRPAFPLPCASPAGVVIAAIASLYGAEETTKMLETISLDRSVRLEVKQMLGANA